METGGDFPTAMRATLAGVLASPSFLFLAEPVRPRGVESPALNGHELASRLSYFLWSSTPDDELLDLARRGTLGDPEVLRAQALRMLRDPMARELSESFATQWLRLDGLYTAKPDPKAFRAFYAGAQGKDTLHGSMLIEALLLFETVMIEDRSVLEFVDAGYTWANPRLLKLYGLPEPAAVPADDGQGAADMPNREKPAPKSNPNNVWRRVTPARPDAGRLRRRWRGP